MLLKDDLRRAMPNRVRDAHAVLTKQFELGVPFCIRRREHPAVARAHDFARMKREARDVAPGPSDLLELAIPRDLTAHCARRILNDGKAITARDRKDRSE